MLGFDIFAVGAVISFIFFGVEAVRTIRANKKAKDPREKGRRNMERMETDTAMRCSLCSKSVNPNVDLFTNGTWWHLGCYQNAINQEL